MVPGDRLARSNRSATPRRGTRPRAELILKVGRIWTGDPDRPLGPGARHPRRASSSPSARPRRSRAYSRAEDSRRSTSRRLRHARPGRRPRPPGRPGRQPGGGRPPGRLQPRGGRPAGEGPDRRRVPATAGSSARNWDQSPLARRRLPDRERRSTPSRRSVRSGSGGSTAIPAGPTPRPCAGPGSRRTRRRRPTARSSATRTGKPTGVFIDGAMGLIDRAIPGPAAGEIARRILAAQAIVLKAGPDGHPRRRASRRAEADAYRRLDREGRLKLRVYAMASPPSGRRGRVRRRPARPGAARRTASRCGRSSSSPTARWARAGPCSSSPTPTTPRNTGLLLIDPKVLGGDDDRGPPPRLAGLHPRHRRPGQRAGPRRLRGRPEGRPEARDPRLRIEHAQHVRKARRRPVRSDRDDRLDAAVALLRRDPLGRRPARPRAVARRLRLALVRGRRGDARLRVSDFPVAVVNPFYGLYAAVTRQTARRPARRRLAPRPAPDPRTGLAGLHRRPGLRQFRRRPARHLEGRPEGRPHRRRPRPVPGPRPRTCSRSRS